MGTSAEAGSEAHQTGNTIIKTKTMTFLGIWVDDRLTFKVHIDMLFSKLRLKMGCLLELNIAFLLTQLQGSNANLVDRSCNCLSFFFFFN